MALTSQCLPHAHQPNSCWGPHLNTHVSLLNKTRVLLGASSYAGSEAFLHLLKVLLHPPSPSSLLLHLLLHLIYYSFSFHQKHPQVFFSLFPSSQSPSASIFSFISFTKSSPKSSSGNFLFPSSQSLLHPSSPSSLLHPSSPSSQNHPQAIFIYSFSFHQNPP